MGFKGRERIPHIVTHKLYEPSLGKKKHLIWFSWILDWYYMKNILVKTWSSSSKCWLSEWFLKSEIAFIYKLELKHAWAFVNSDSKGWHSVDQSTKH